LLLLAVVASRKHFDREERIVFPLAEKVMKDETLAELGKTWMKQRDAESA
jgi:hemerythrin-like domain-containing protein